MTKCKSPTAFAAGEVRRHRAPRPQHEWLYALPGAALPAQVLCEGCRYEWVETFKHDFFAATGRYDGPGGPAVLKLGRETDLLSFPMRWAGQWLESRELRLLRQLQGVPGIPRLIGTVGPNGLLREYIPGRPLGRRDAVSDRFFDQLVELVGALHARDMAYVDLNKRQNILVGTDGRPYLIDFQISLYLPPAWQRVPGARWLLRRFQQADLYHCLKHKRRLRSDLLTPAERARVERVSIWIRAHRVLTRPLTYLRRRTLARLGRSETVHVSGADAK